MQTSDPALAMLEALFQRWQRVQGESRTRSLNLAGRDGKAYLATQGIAREAFHAVMENAERAGAIRITMGRFAASHEIARIDLADGNKLASFLGRLPAAAYVGEMSSSLAPVLENAAPWLLEVWSESVARWNKGEPAWRLRLPGNASDAMALFKALDAVDKGQHMGLDMRSFSARQLGDSKIMERIRYGFCDAWRRGHDVPYIENEDLLTSLGLEKSLQPIILRGPLELRTEGHVVRLSDIGPWFGLPGESLANLYPGKPDYLLTVENWASFSLYCREIQDGGLVVYTGGFPNPGIQKLLSGFGRILEPEVGFFHWGDTDVRGLEILAFLIEKTGRNIVPHRMDRNPWRSMSIPAERESATLRRIAERYETLRPLIEKLIDYGVPYDFEQENLPPQTPKVGA